MNADTAEKKLIAIINDAHPSLTQEDKTAILLGIQSLKRLHLARTERRYDRLKLLPGETI